MAKATTGARQREAQGWIVGLIGEGLRNTHIVEFLRSFDMGYRDSVMYADINRLRTGVLSRQDIAQLGPGEAVNPANMLPIHGREVEPYRSIVTVDFTDNTTGETISRTVTMHHHNAPSQNDVLNEIEGRRELWIDQSGMTISRVVDIEYRVWVPDAE